MCSKDSHFKIFTFFLYLNIFYNPNFGKKKQKSVPFEVHLEVSCRNEVMPLNEDGLLRDVRPSYTLRAWVEPSGCEICRGVVRLETCFFMFCPFFGCLLVLARFI